jgi:hypothetical protein
LYSMSQSAIDAAIRDITACLKKSTTCRTLADSHIMEYLKTLSPEKVGDHSFSCAKRL